MALCKHSCPYLIAVSEPLSVVWKLTSGAMWHTARLIHASRSSRSRCISFQSGLYYAYAEFACSNDVIFSAGANVFKPGHICVVPSTTHLHPTLEIVSQLHFRSVAVPICRYLLLESLILPSKPNDVMVLDLSDSPNYGITAAVEFLLLAR